MKPIYLLGIIAIAIGILWINVVTSFLLTNVLPLSVPVVEIWAESVYSPSAIVSTLIYLVLLLSWVFFSSKQRCKSSSETRNYKSLWYSLFFLGTVCNMISLFLFIKLTNVDYGTFPSMQQGFIRSDWPGWEFLIPFTFVNAILIFWLPSTFLTMKTLRFIPPFSYQLCSLLEKR